MNAGANREIGAVRGRRGEHVSAPVCRSTRCGYRAGQLFGKRMERRGR